MHPRSPERMFRAKASGSAQHDKGRASGSAQHDNPLPALPSFLRRQEPRPVLGRPSHAPPRSTLTLALSPCRERGRALTTTRPAGSPTRRPRRRPASPDAGACSANGGGLS